MLGVLGEGETGVPPGAQWGPPPEGGLVSGLQGGSGGVLLVVWSGVGVLRTIPPLENRGQPTRPEGVARGSLT